MKKVVLIFFVVLFAAFAFIAPSLATDSGPVPIGYPALTIGYTTQSWECKPLSNISASNGFFNLSDTNIDAADQAVAVYGNTLNGTSVPDSTVNATGKKVVLLSHNGSFLLYPDNATSPFPSIWVKGTNANTATGVNSPATYISGTQNNYFYQTGLTIQAPYWDVSNYQWTVYVYADRDILSQTAGPVTGRILDPRISTLRWYSWQDDANGAPKVAWGFRPPAAATPTMFNVMPLLDSSATAQQMKTFLTSTTGASTPETHPLMAAISGMAQASIPADGSIYYNTDRNIAAANNANSFSISGRSQIGLVYASPSDYTSHRTEYLHVQFVAVWPATIGVSPGSKSCTINIYQRTAP